MEPPFEYRTLTDAARADEVCGLMAALYAEDPPERAPPAGAFRATVDHLLAHPERGRVVLFARAGAPAGYALLVPYWSNEFGGVILFVDELYVVPGARGRGAARGLFALVERERPFGAVAAALEVTPGNRRARALYEALGFRARANATLARRFA